MRGALTSQVHGEPGAPRLALCSCATGTGTQCIGATDSREQRTKNRSPSCYSRRNESFRGARRKKDTGSKDSGRGTSNE
eukprot:scaffold285748_cov28-Tisochrysis_lutea.AAC.2